MKNMFDLSGKRALITGSARGIGNLLARGLAEYGAEVVLNDRCQQRADEAAQILTEKGYRASGFDVDVTKSIVIKQAVATIEEKLGAIEILNNNAGIQRRYPFTEFHEEDWNKIIEVYQNRVFLVV